MPLSTFLAAVAMGALVAAGCGGSDGSGEAASADEPLTIGVLASLSGPVAIQGNKFADGARLAVEDVNADGGIESLGGRELEIKVVDDQSDPGASRQAAIELITDDEVPALVGPYGSAVCLAAAPVAEQHQTPTICSANSDEVTAQEYSFTFNLGTVNSTYSRQLFAFLDDVNAGQPSPDLRRIALIFEDGPFGVGVRDEVEALAEESGYEIVATLSHSAGDPNLSPLLTRAKGAGAQVVVSGGFSTDVINTLKAMRTTGSEDLMLIGFTGNVINPSVAELGETADGVVGLSNWNSDVGKSEGLADFVASYEEAHGEPPSSDSASGWTGIKTLVAALEESGSLESADVREAILSLDIQLEVTPQNRVAYDESGLMANQDETVIGAQFQDGAFVTVWPSEFAAAELTLP